MFLPSFVDRVAAAVAAASTDSFVRQFLVLRTIVASFGSIALNTGFRTMLHHPKVQLILTGSAVLLFFR